MNIIIILNTMIKNWKKYENYESAKLLIQMKNYFKLKDIYLV